MVTTMTQDSAARCAAADEGSGWEEEQLERMGRSVEVSKALGSHLQVVYVAQVFEHSSLIGEKRGATPQQARRRGIEAALYELRLTPQ